MDATRVSVVLTRESDDVWCVTLSWRKPGLVQIVKRYVTDVELRQANFWAMHTVFPLSAEDGE